jgi:hypothetical protein
MYVDDVLTLSHQPMVLVNAIGEYYKVKLGSKKEPEIYLGVNIEKCRCWTVGKYGPVHLMIMSRMLLTLWKVCLRKMVKGTY